ncbi:MAG: hypothetical protein IKM94_02825 [Alphaproteobacteria bacterium]|nr:hypothetical protein [Alphaproteobacteria bacterium]
MTQQEFDSFVKLLIDLNGATPPAYWDLLDLAHKKLTEERVNNIKKSLSLKNLADRKLNELVIDFYEHQSDPDVKIYLKTVRLLLPIIARHDQFDSHKEFTEIEYYKQIIEFVQFIGDAKLQYDILTRVIDKLENMRSTQRLSGEKIEVVYSVARALRGANDFAQQSTNRYILDTHLEDLNYYMQISNNMRGIDKGKLKQDIAFAMANTGWKMMGDIAACPHAHFGPNNQFDTDIAKIGNRVRRSVASGGAIPEINEVLDKVVWPSFETSHVRQQILEKHFNPNEIESKKQALLLAMAKQNNQPR